jgi:hypothetical protein
MLEDESMALPYRADWPETMAGSDDGPVRQGFASLSSPRPEISSQFCHPGQAKREPGSFQTQAGVFHDPVSAGRRSALRRAAHGTTLRIVIPAKRGASRDRKRTCVSM